MMLMLTSLVLLPEASSKGPYVIFSEDFEAGFSLWTADDANAEFGDDYWGISSVRVHTGSYGAYCAQLGVNHINDFLNADNRYYDESMDAQMWVELSDLSGFESLSLSFMYWAETGTFSRADYLSVWINSLGAWVSLWEQPGVSSGGWQTVTIDIPNTTTTLLFRFISDTTVGFGPYEGVYVDDIALVGIDRVPPVIQINDPVEEGQIITSSSVPISWTGSDAASGIDYYEVTLDRRSPVNVGTSETTVLVDVPDGDHTVIVTALDRAGNRATASKSFRVDTNPLSPTGPFGIRLIVALISVAIIAVGLFAYWRHRRRTSREEGPPPPLG